MKKTIKETTRLLLQGTLTKDEADKILLDLHNVVGRSEQLCDFLEWYDESLSYEEREMHVKTYTDMKSHN